MDICSTRIGFLVYIYIYIYQYCFFGGVYYFILSFFHSGTYITFSHITISLFEAALILSHHGLTISDHLFIYNYIDQLLILF